MFENFTNAARSVVSRAQEEARELGHGDVGPEHLLIALTRHDTIAAKALADIGADSSAVDGWVIAVSTRETARRYGIIPFTPAARYVMTCAHQLAARLGSNNVEPEHLLFAVTAVDDTVVGEVLSLLGLSTNEVQESLARHLVGSGAYIPKAEREAAGCRHFTVYADAAGAIHLEQGAGRLAARFALHPGELLSIRDAGAIDEEIRFLDYRAVRTIAEQRGADVVILTSRQTEITAVDAGGEMVTVGEATVWSPVEIADRLVPAGA